jgi:hypothetical protein
MIFWKEMINTTTPPPWEIADYSCCDGDGKYDICFQIGRSDTGETIAELNGEGEKNYKHVKRNAELVRAAPELLELLIDVQAELRNCARTLDDPFFNTQAEYYAEKTRNFIRKIEG